MSDFDPVVCKVPTHQGKPCKRGHVGIRRDKGGDCIECKNVRMRERWARDPEFRNKWLAHRRSRYDSEEGRKYRRERNLIAKFGLTLADFDRLVKEQDGKCACCGGPPSGRHKQLAVDHCHESGKRRQLLCQLCNVGLGSFKDDPKRLKQAIEYLAKHGRV